MLRASYSYLKAILKFYCGYLKVIFKLSYGYLRAILNLSLGYLQARAITRLPQSIPEFSAKSNDLARRKMHPTSPQITKGNIQVC